MALDGARRGPIVLEKCMLKDEHDSLLAPVLTWPETAQEKLVRAIREIRSPELFAMRRGQTAQGEQWLWRDNLISLPCRD